WNGTLEPRLVLKAVCPTSDGHCEVIGERPLWDDLAAELDTDPRVWLVPERRRTQHDIDGELARGRAGSGGPASAAARAGSGARVPVDRRGQGIAAVCGELLAGGESVLAVCADARRRADGLASLVAGLALEQTEFAAVGWSDLVAQPSLASGY